MSFGRPVVVDTGVLVSAAIRPGSVPALALEKALLHFDICCSAETWQEVETVLMHDKFDRYLSLPQRLDFLRGLQTHLTSYEANEAVTDCVDPQDNKFLALAWTARAELIIASDPHLTALHPWRDIPILPPAAFLVGVR